MSRRKGHHDEELPFVALMDTMTNVVGVLIIVLVMVGIGLARSVNKVLSDLPPVTVEEHAQLQKQVADSAPKADPEKLEKEKEKLLKDLKKSAEELKDLELAKDKQNVKIVDVDELKKQLEEKRKERERCKTEVDRLLAEIDRLKKQLDTTPAYQPPPAVVVKLPAPRPMPDKAVIQRFLVIGKRVYYIADEEIRDLIEEELRVAEPYIAQSRETLKGPDGNPVMTQDKSGRAVPMRKVVYDPKKLTDHFSRRGVGNRDFKTELLTYPNSPTINFRMTPLPGRGETVEQTRGMVSNFQALMRKFKADPKAVIWFQVYRDSLETYLIVRDVADQLGMPVGWELYYDQHVLRSLSPQFAVAHEPRPPSAPLSAPPVPGARTGINIPPPKAVLD
jgi:hypothetical protein